MFGFLLLVSCMCAAPQDGSTSFAARRSGQQLQRSSGHRIDEFRPVGFRTRFEGPSPNQQATRESCSRCCRKDPEVAGGNSNSGKFQGGQTSPGSPSRCSGTRLSASIQGACGFVQAFLDVPRSACSVRKRSSTELANRKFCTKQKSSRAKRGYTAWRRRSGTRSGVPTMLWFLERDAFRSATGRSTRDVDGTRSSPFRRHPTDSV